MDQHLAAADSAEFTAVESAETHTERDVVGGITLSGRNRACARARCWPAWSSPAASSSR